jgi:hypothetical protein
MAMPRGVFEHKRKPTVDRLAEKLELDPETGCMNWTGSLTHNGYGQIGLHRPAGGHMYNVRAHRLAYELAHGPIPDGMQIDHLCRNRKCCNPDHLEAVTPIENTRRGMSPSAISARTGLCFKGHPLTEENVTISRGGGRQCLICRREYSRALRQKKRAVTPCAETNT